MHRTTVMLKKTQSYLSGTSFSGVKNVVQMVGASGLKRYLVGLHATREFRRTPDIGMLDQLAHGV